jgi:hypothetical protein
MRLELATSGVASSHCRRDWVCLSNSTPQFRFMRCADAISPVTNNAGIPQQGARCECKRDTCSKFFCRVSLIERNAIPP